MTMPSISSQQQVAQVWRSGGLCVVASQLGYLLAGLPMHAGAIARLAAMKDGQSNKALPCFAHSFDLIQGWLPLPRLCHELAQRFWPDQLTFVVEPPDLQDRLSPFGGRMAVQGLQTGWMAEQITALGGLLVGWPLPDGEGQSCFDLQKVDRFAIALADEIIDEGPLPQGSAEATVLAFRGAQPVMLRQGGVPQVQVEQILGQDIWIV